MTWVVKRERRVGMTWVVKQRKKSRIVKRKRRVDMTIATSKEIRAYRRELSIGVLGLSSLRACERITQIHILIFQCKLC
jgi:hypothetical protein